MHNENEGYYCLIKLLKIEMFESFLVHFYLNSLLLKYGPFNILYNTQRKMVY